MNIDEEVSSSTMQTKEAEKEQKANLDWCQGNCKMQDHGYQC